MSPLLLVLVSILPLLTHQQCWAPPNHGHSDSESFFKLSAGQQTFSFDLLKEIVKSGKDDSVFFSPLSVYKALLLAYFGSATHTEVDLKKALHLPTELAKTDVMKAFMFEKLQAASRALNSSTATPVVSVNNHLFFTNRLKLTDCIAIVFNFETSMMDFTETDVAREKINAWVEEQTAGMIKDMMKDDQIDATTQIVLVNTAYFKGEWLTGFKYLRQEPFHLTQAEDVNITMMRQTAAFSYYYSEDHLSHFLELPYKGDRVSMYILMPKTLKINGSCGVDVLIASLTPELFASITENLMMTSDTLNLGVPKFTVEKELELTPILERLDVGDVFRASADLSDFTGQRGVTLDEAWHKAKVEVDENGTTAAAATMMFGTRSSRPNHQKFTVNKPFVYFIYDKVEKAMLFTGVYRTPPS